MQFPGYSRAVAITTSDTVAIAASFTIKAIYVGGAGNLVVLPSRNGTSVVTLTGVIAGTILPIQAKRVNATNTTASLLIALGD